MARPSPELARQGRGPPPRDPDSHVPLRLTVARGTLGLELYEPIVLGPLVVEQMEVSLPNLRFPMDLSGGVPVFRHHRGRLERVQIRLSLHALARYLSRRLRDALGGLERSVSVWAIDKGLGIGLLGRNGALAFDLLWIPVEGDARVVVTRARAAHLDGVALGTALQIIDGAFGPIAQRSGRLLQLPRLGHAVARQVFPAIGARVPRSGNLRASLLEVSGDEVRVAVDSNYLPVDLSPALARATELALLTREADDELARGQWDTARAAFIGALERAPRHPEISTLVAEIDLGTAERAEAALSLLSEAMPVTDAGAIGAELLARAGDLEGARVALEKSTRAEEFAPVAALRWQRLAEMDTTLGGRLAALDQAVARAPSLAEPRWTRLRARLDRGDLQGAMADAQHLEGAAQGSQARHAVNRRAATLLLEAGFVEASGKLFERALRYLPNDAAATAGLARSFLESGKIGRAAALLERAIDLGAERGDVFAESVLDLAKILAERFGDLPQAIARARAVPVDSRSALEARFLEGRWRARLGDLVGASLAFARAREAAELAGVGDVRAVAAFLAEAASFESDVMGHAVEAERHMAVAVRLFPRDRAVGALYRKLAAAVARARNERSGPS